MNSSPVPAALAALALASCLSGPDPAPLLPRSLVTAPEPGAESDVGALWNDPVFQKQFVAGYAVNAEIEPRFSPEEVKVLEEVRPLMAENLPAAEELLREKTEPDSSAMLDFMLGSALFGQEKLPEALASFETAVGKFPSFRRAWRNLGLIHVRSGDHDQAIHAFTRMIELGGGDGYSYGLLGMAYAAKQDYQAAEAAYRNALLLQPETIDWRMGLTSCVFRQGKFQDAAALLDALIARHPDEGQFWLLQADTFLGLEQRLRAAENIEVADRLGQAAAENLYTLGDIYVSENLPDLAVSAYERAIGRDDGQDLAQPLRAAEALTARGATAQARRVAVRIHETWDARMEAAERGKLLKLEAQLSMAEGAGNPETARILEEILHVDPLDGQALMLLGEHYSGAHEPDRAIFYYERAASLDDFEATAKVHHAVVLVGMGRYTDAVPLLRRAQEVKARDEIARYLEQVERLARSRG